MATSGQSLRTPGDLQKQLDAYGVKLSEEQVVACLEGMVIAGLCTKPPQTSLPNVLTKYAFAHDVIWQHLQSMQLTETLAEQVRMGGQ
jgi:hypothetical protein